MSEKKANPKSLGKRGLARLTIVQALYQMQIAEHHKDEIESGDHHDPNVLEVFCDIHPDEPECLVYDD